MARSLSLSGTSTTENEHYAEGMTLPPSIRRPSFLARFLDDSGASMIEYALLIVLIAIIAIAAVNLTGNEVSESFRDVASELR